MAHAQSSLVSSTAKYARRLLHVVLYGTAMGTIALTSNVVQVVTLLLYPFSRRAVARINAKICEVIWRTIDFAMERHNKAQITFSGDITSIPVNEQPVLLSPNPKLNAIESAIVISNHCAAMDWALINAVAMRRGMLAHCKYFVKASMQWVPFFGPGMRLAGFPYLSRNWAADNKKIEAVFHVLKSDKLPCWLISFLEGTRITPKKLAESQAFSRSKNLPVFENVMYPRKKGFVATLQALRDSHVRYVYDVTLAYLHVPSGQVNAQYPDLLVIHTDDLSKEWAFHVHVDRIAIEDIPVEDEAVGKWIEERWKVKDQRLAAYKANWPKIGKDGVYSLPFY
ncbi:acyltransferase-domain-containing protein [Catenaria anguillulae PL171]|uniref:Acyltransferase-domain-containing protein n=1 Tax=Catenaria anguillulae PL171 TaxID=765915 RepID=A0A1Y2HH49_9FUNG|nr:acyltransferase-domain-containing protein [Catenaria anguillulae PL171]